MEKKKINPVRNSRGVFGSPRVSPALAGLKLPNAVTSPPEAEGIISNGIKTEKEIERLAVVLKRNRKRIVACSGTFDLLHPGHVSFLHEARQFGDFLIVLLNSDASVRKYKGLLRPINHERARSTVLAALTDVDAVALFSQKTPVQILKRVKPDVYCQGEDWGVNCVERPVVEKYGGRIVVLPKIIGFSTTNIIKIIAKKFSK